jgi:hypothetical protein
MTSGHFLNPKCLCSLEPLQNGHKRLCMVLYIWLICSYGLQGLGWIGSWLRRTIWLRMMSPSWNVLWGKFCGWIMLGFICRFMFPLLIYNRSRCNREINHQDLLEFWKMSALKVVESTSFQHSSRTIYNHQAIVLSSSGVLWSLAIV